MPFQPINDDHAIQQVTFGIALGKPVVAATVDTLRAEPASWRADMPAVEITQMIDLRMDAAGNPRPVMVRGAEFSFKRPDGSPQTSLAILGNEIQIQISKYTRWDPTWEKVWSYITALLGRLAALEKERAQVVQTVSLVILDAFRSSDAQPKFDEVLARSSAIAHSVFERGAAWHNHTGWFVAHEKGRILNQMNIDTKSVSVVDPITGQKTEPSELTITHRQVTMFDPHLKLEDVETDQLNADINGAFEAMHLANKREVSSLLTSAMRERIRIDQ